MHIDRFRVNKFNIRFVTTKKSFLSEQKRDKVSQCLPESGSFSNFMKELEIDFCEEEEDQALPSF
jgi:hypothetical protein